MSRKIKISDGNIIEYSILTPVDSYDPRLHVPCENVDFTKVEGSVLAYEAMSLMETCNQLGALGLSANQVGLTHSMCAVNMIGENKIWCLINPKIIERSEEMTSFNEGCVSFPGLFLKINRPDHITVEFNAVGGEKIVQSFDGMTAVIIQHEIDHLNGIVYTELVPKVKLQIAKRKIPANLRKLKQFNKKHAAQLAVSQ